MTIEFGTWDSKSALGEKLYVANKQRQGYSDNDINHELRYYKDSGTVRQNQETAEKFLELLGSSHGGSSALFGPIDRSKENTDRIHAITLSMGVDTGKHNRVADAYNATAVPIFILQRSDGSYITPANGRTNNKEEARSFYSREEITQVYPSHQAVGWTIVEV